MLDRDGVSQFHAELFIRMTLSPDISCYIAQVAGASCICIQSGVLHSMRTNHDLPFRHRFARCQLLRIKCHEEKWGWGEGRQTEIRARVKTRATSGSEL